MIQQLLFVVCLPGCLTGDLQGLALEYAKQFKKGLVRLGRITLPDTEASLDGQSIIGKFKLRRGYLGTDLELNFVGVYSSDVSPLPEGATQGEEVRFTFRIPVVRMYYRFTTPSPLGGAAVAGSVNVTLTDQPGEARVTSQERRGGGCVLQDRGLTLTLTRQDHTADLFLDIDTETDVRTLFTDVMMAAKHRNSTFLVRRLSGDINRAINDRLSQATQATGLQDKLKTVLCGQSNQLIRTVSPGCSVSC